ncbi:MAG TPA: hypothetical protein PLX89_09590 [Verrucomicrobiota bacterium]|nr:hypothetical protein [Verrucomicrobiales bacterium]HRI13247.1 hypothetical protein [Verrucomicrobiota bacterium]
MPSGPPTPDAIRQRLPKQAFQIVFVIAGVLILPAALTLRTVLHPVVPQNDSPNPTPYGYSWSLLLFIIPLAVVSGWFIRRRDLTLARRSFWRALAVLAPTGIILDLLFGNAFFTFTNKQATVGIDIPAVGGPIPIEEFIFYVTGFMLVLLSYIWADEYWMAAYNVPDYRVEAQNLPRIARFHVPSVILGAALLAAAVIYKWALAPSPAGFPWYFTYLTAVAIVPSAGFFHTARPFINWRAFSFTFFLILLISLLWEVTLAIPYGWWGYRPATMMGLFIDAWPGLPIEAVCVWLAVTFTTVIIYEVIKIWQALGKGTLEAFFGIGKEH